MDIKSTVPADTGLFDLGDIKVNLTIAADKNYFIDGLMAQWMLKRLSFGLHSNRVLKVGSEIESFEVRKKLKDHLIETGYTLAKIRREFLAIKTETFNSSIVNCVVLFSGGADDVSLECSGDEAEVKRIEDYFIELINKPKDAARVTTVLPKDEASFSYQFNTLRKEKDNMGLQCFYPNMKMPLEEYFEAFMKSKSNILLLKGPAGTGKSTFIRSLICSGMYKTMLAYSKEVIQTPKLVKEYHDNNAELLILEDIDHFLGKRTEGNGLMSHYLNSSEGVISRATKKMVFSTNLTSLSKVDEALIRKGRCFDIVTFDFLTIEQARAVEQELGLSEQDFGTQTKVALAEVLNPPFFSLQSETRTAKPIGFNK